MSKTMPRTCHQPAHCLAIAALLTCAAPCVCANDFEAGGIGAALAPVAHSRIRMLTERVTLEKSGTDHGYRFTARTGPLTLRVLKDDISQW